MPHVIKELDRLGRNMGMIKEEWNALTKNGIDIINNFDIYYLETSTIICF